MELDRITLIKRLQAAAARLGRPPRRDEFCDLCSVSERTYLKQFDSYQALVRASGFDLKRTAQRHGDDALMRHLRDGLAAAGGVVGQKRYAMVGPHHATIRRRWHGWDKALAALRDWLAVNEPEFPHLEALRQYCKLREAAAAAPLGPRCGELIRFRALDHAPTSESAVVFLFGGVAEELGFVMEMLNTAFPDGEGRRRIGDIWRRVRIEFELRSRNFRDHGHSARGCNLVVCWEHNWPDCPVEVLELKREIKRLRDTARE